MDISLTNIFFIFIAGLTSVISPCILPVVPIIVTGTSNDHKFRPLLIVAGLSISFIIMGVVSTIFGALIAGRFLYIEKAAGVIIALFGILMLFDVNLFKKATFFGRFQSNFKGNWSGFFLGLSLGIIWIPCIGPILSGVLALVASQGKLVGGIVLLMVYSLGFSVPILLAGYGSQLFRQRITGIQKHRLIIRILSGSILILFGIYIFDQGLLNFSL